MIMTTGAMHPLPPVMGLGKFLSGMPLDHGNPALLRAPVFSASFSANRLNNDPPGYILITPPSQVPVPHVLCG